MPCICGSREKCSPLSGFRETVRYLGSPTGTQYNRESVSDLLIISDRRGRIWLEFGSPAPAPGTEQRRGVIALVIVRTM